MAPDWTNATERDDSIFIRDLQSMTNALPTFAPCLSKLDLSSVGLLPRWARVLSEGLREFPKLQKVKLGCEVPEECVNIMRRTLGNKVEVIC